MTPTIESPATPASRDDDVSAFAIAAALLRHRRMILVLAAIGGVLGLVRGLSSSRVYKSTATFIPQGAQTSSSGLALAASQLGFSIPSAGGAWTPQMYVELVRSRAVLMPIVLDTVTVAEDEGKRQPLIDLLKVTGITQDARNTAAVQSLSSMIEAAEDKKLGGVTFSVFTRWPSVSLAVAERLVDRVNGFNIETRKSQALAEREFVEKQVVQSETSLRDAENRLQSFLQGNRDIGSSPALTFERDRLQREVVRLNQLYTSLLQSREEARIREIRDTPVITVIEDPRLPFIGEPRKSVQKAIVGGFAGLAFGGLLAFLVEAYQLASQASSEEAREFFRLLNDAMPGFLKLRRQ
jgi:uncharacterized protein involved in exopolysaccharide biosynthesis